MEEIAGHDNILGRTAGCGESQDLGRGKSQVKGGRCDEEHVYEYLASISRRPGRWLTAKQAHVFTAAHSSRQYKTHNHVRKSLVSIKAACETLGVVSILT